MPFSMPSLSMPNLSLPNLGLMNKFGSWTSWCWEQRDKISYTKIIGFIGTIASLYGIYYAYGTYKRRIIEENMKRNYPIILKLNPESNDEYDQTRKDGKVIYVRMSADSRKVFTYVMDMYDTILRTKGECQEFKKYWATELKDNQEVRSTLESNNDSSNNDIQTKIKDINDRIGRLNDKFKRDVIRIQLNDNEDHDFEQNPRTLFALEMDKFILSYDRGDADAWDDNDYEEDDCAMYHLNYIRQAFQLLEKGNMDRHDIKCLSSGIAELMLRIHPWEDWKKDTSINLLNQKVLEDVTYNRHQIQSDTVGWEYSTGIIGLGIDAARWGYNTIANRFGKDYVWQEPQQDKNLEVFEDMLRNTVDLKTDEFVEEGADQVYLNLQ